MKNARKNYFATPIPEKELADRLSIACNSPTSPPSHKFVYKVILNAVWLSVTVVFVILARTSPSFAAAAETIPGLRQIVWLISPSPRQENNQLYTLQVSEPKITNSPSPEWEQAINAEITKRINFEAEAAKKLAMEFCQARIDTGTPPEEAGGVTIIIDNQLHYADETHLSFEISIFQNIASAYNKDIFYNLDFSTGKSLKLADLFPDNYLETINTEIRRQIHDRLQNDKNAMFFKEDEGGFKTITPDQNFYINSDGKVVIVFEKYEIAPGYMGRQDFALPLPVTFPEYATNSESPIN